MPEVERHRQGVLLVAQIPVAGARVRSFADRQGGQGPGPAGELAGDCGGGDDVLLVRAVIVAQRW